MSIAKETQTLAFDPEGAFLAYSRDGQIISQDVAAKISGFVWKTIDEAFQYSNSHGESIPSERSLFDFFKEKIQQSSFSSAEKELCLDACKLWGAYVGDPIERQSLKFFRLEECVDGSEFASLLKGSLLLVFRIVSLTHILMNLP